MSEKAYGRPDRDPFWFRHPVISVAAVILALILCGWGAYAVKVALSPVKGAGDVIIKQNDADTMIRAQAELQERYNGLAAACARIDIAKKAADADPTNRITAANYTGAQQHYVSLVSEYNAAASKLLYAKMLGNLPESVSTNDCAGVN